MSFPQNNGPKEANSALFNQFDDQKQATILDINDPIFDTYTSDALIDLVKRKPNIIDMTQPEPGRIEALGLTGYTNLLNYFGITQPPIAIINQLLEDNKARFQGLPLPLHTNKFATDDEESSRFKGILTRLDRKYQAVSIDLDEPIFDGFSFDMLKKLVKEDTSIVGMAVPNRQRLQALGLTHSYGTTNTDNTSNNPIDVLKLLVDENLRNFHERPSPYEYAVMAEAAYNDEFKIGSTLHRSRKGEITKIFPEWKVVDQEDAQNESGYRGLVFYNTRTHQIVLASRGTDADDDLSKSALVDLIQDLSVATGGFGFQAADFFNLLQRTLQRADKLDARLSFTGHSLGGFWAEIGVWVTTDNIREDAPVKLLKASEYVLKRGLNAVVFDSPGCERTILNHQDYKPVLDIVDYVACPNFINTLNRRIGKIYKVFTKNDFSQAQYCQEIGQGELGSDYNYWSVGTHALQPIVDAFDPMIGVPRVLVELDNWPYLGDQTIANLLNILPDSYQLFNNFLSGTLASAGGVFFQTMADLRDANNKFKKKMSNIDDAFNILQEASKSLAKEHLKSNKARYAITGEMEVALHQKNQAGEIDHANVSTQYILAEFRPYISSLLIALKEHKVVSHMLDNGISLNDIFQNYYIPGDVVSALGNYEVSPYDPRRAEYTRILTVKTGSKELFRDTVTAFLSAYPLKIRSSEEWVDRLLNIQPLHCDSECVVPMENKLPRHITTVSYTKLYHILWDHYENTLNKLRFFDGRQLDILEAYIPLFAKGESLLQSNQQKLPESLGALDLVTNLQGSHIRIDGDAGVGKSTLLLYLLASWMSHSGYGEISSNANLVSQLANSFDLVIYISLKDLVKTVDRFSLGDWVDVVVCHMLGVNPDMIEDGLRTELMQQEEQGRILFLLDAYDEVYKDLVKNRSLSQVIKEYLLERKSIIATTRPYVVHDLVDFKAFRITGFTKENAELYVQRFIQELSLSDVQYKDKGLEIIRFIQNESIQALTHVAVNLESICSTWIYQSENLEQDDVILTKTGFYISLLDQFIRRYVEKSKFVDEPHKTFSREQLFKDYRIEPLLLFMSQLAFLVRDEVQGLISQAVYYELDSQYRDVDGFDAINLGFIKPTDDSLYEGNPKNRDYIFTDANHQEFLSAYYVAYRIKNGGLENSEAIKRFITEEAYQHSLTIRYVAGLLSHTDSPLASQKALMKFFVYQLRIPTDLVGARFVHHWIDLLDESLPFLPNPPRVAARSLNDLQRKVSTDQGVEQLLNLIESEPLLIISAVLENLLESIKYALCNYVIQSNFRQQKVLLTSISQAVFLKKIITSDIEELLQETWDHEWSNKGSLWFSLDRAKLVRIAHFSAHIKVSHSNTRAFLREHFINYLADLISSTDVKITQDVDLLVEAYDTLVDFTDLPSDLTDSLINKLMSQLFQTLKPAVKNRNAFALAHFLRDKPSEVRELISTHLSKLSVRTISTQENLNSIAAASIFLAHFWSMPIVRTTLTDTVFKVYQADSNALKELLNSMAYLSQKAITYNPLPELYFSILVNGLNDYDIVIATKCASIVVQLLMNNNFKLENSEKTLYYRKITLEKVIANPLRDGMNAQLYNVLKLKILYYMPVNFLRENQHYFSMIKHFLSTELLSQNQEVKKIGKSLEKQFENINSREIINTRHHLYDLSQIQRLIYDGEVIHQHIAELISSHGCREEVVPLVSSSSLEHFHIFDNCDFINVYYQIYEQKYTEWFLNYFGGAQVRRKTARQIFNKALLQNVAIYTAGNKLHFSGLTFSFSTPLTDMAQRFLSDLQNVRFVKLIKSQQIYPTTQIFAYASQAPDKQPTDLFRTPLIKPKLHYEAPQSIEQWQDQSSSTALSPIRLIPDSLCDNFNNILSHEPGLMSRLASNDHIDGRVFITQYLQARTPVSLESLMATKPESLMILCHPGDEKPLLINTLQRAILSQQNLISVRLSDLSISKNISFNEQLREPTSNHMLLIDVDINVDIIPSAWIHDWRHRDAIWIVTRYNNVPELSSFLKYKTDSLHASEIDDYINAYYTKHLPERLAHGKSAQIAKARKSSDFIQHLSTRTGYLQKLLKNWIVHEMSYQDRTETSLYYYYGDALFREALSDKGDGIQLMYAADIYAKLAKPLTVLYEAAFKAYQIYNRVGELKSSSELQPILQILMEHQLLIFSEDKVYFEDSGFFDYLVAQYIASAFKRGSISIESFIQNRIGSPYHYRMIALTVGLLKSDKPGLSKLFNILELNNASLTLLLRCLHEAAGGKNHSISELLSQMKLSIEKRLLDPVEYNSYTNALGELTSLYGKADSMFVTFPAWVTDLSGFNWLIKMSSLSRLDDFWVSRAKKLQLSTHAPTSLLASILLGEANLIKLHQQMRDSATFPALQPALDNVQHNNVNSVSRFVNLVVISAAIDSLLVYGYPKDDVQKEVERILSLGQQYLSVDEVAWLTARLQPEVFQLQGLLSADLAALNQLPVSSMAHITPSDMVSTIVSGLRSEDSLLHELALIALVRVSRLMPQLLSTPDIISESLAAYQSMFSTSPSLLDKLYNSLSFYQPLSGVLSPSLHKATSVHSYYATFVLSLLDTDVLLPYASNLTLDLQRQSVKAPTVLRPMIAQVLSRLPSSNSVQPLLSQLQTQLSSTKITLRSENYLEAFLGSCGIKTHITHKENQTIVNIAFTEQPSSETGTSLCRFNQCDSETTCSVEFDIYDGSEKAAYSSKSGYIYHLGENSQLSTNGECEPEHLVHAYGEMVSHLPSYELQQWHRQLQQDFRWGFVPAFFMGGFRKGVYHLTDRYPQQSKRRLLMRMVDPALILRVIYASWLYQIGQITITRAFTPILATLALDIILSRLFSHHHSGAISTSIFLGYGAYQDGWTSTLSRFIGSLIGSMIGYKFTEIGINWLTTLTYQMVNVLFYQHGKYASYQNKISNLAKEGFFNLEGASFLYQILQILSEENLFLDSFLDDLLESAENFDRCSSIFKQILNDIQTARLSNSIEECVIQDILSRRLSENLHSSDTSWERREKTR